MSYTDYTIKKMADLTGYTKSPIVKTIKQLGIEPYKKGTQIQYYTAEQAREIILKLLPAFDTIELDKEIAAYKAARAELEHIPTEQEKAAAENKLIEQRAKEETAQQQLLIDLLKEQLTAKDKQIQDYNKQLAAKDEQITEKDKQITELANTISEQTKSLTEQTSIINKQAAAIAEMNTSISQAQQLTLIAQADKIKEMQREQTAAEQKETEKAGAGGGADEQQGQAEKTAANMSFWEKVKFVFKK